MKKIDRNLIDSMRSIFTNKFLENVARETKFIQRKSALTAEGFLSLCTLSGNSICKDSLSTLSSALAAKENINISSQALFERFNNYSVEFLKAVLQELLIKQNKILGTDLVRIQSLFNRINVTDATSFKIADNLKEIYKGTGGSNAASAAVKILLQYNILAGKFHICDIDKAATSDSSYLPKLQRYVEPKDLILKDLGYFKIDDLDYIDKNQAYYISKVKKCTLIFIKYGKGYSQVDILDKVKSLTPGEILEIPEVYLGAKKVLKTRLIITKLSEDDKRKRALKNLEDSKRHKGKGRLNTKDLDIWNGINIYATNLNEDMLTASQIHDLYTLRWQVEIMFKIWKSIFKIDEVKKVGLYRFECFLYGKLIFILLSSIIVFKAKEIIYVSYEKSISEYKAFAIVKDNTCKLRVAIFKSTTATIRILNKIINLIFKCAIKSRKKHKKSTLDILKSTKPPEYTMEKAAI